VIEFSALQSAIRGWASNAAPSEVTQVVYADQNAPRPPRPFVTLRLTPLGTVGQSYIGEPDSDGVATILHDLELSCSVQAFGPCAMQITSTPLGSLERATVNDRFRSAGLAFIRDTAGILDVTALTGTEFEPRAQFDIEFRTTGQILDDIGFIETVIASGEINDIPIEMQVEV